jgi:hypothetical protein
MAKHEAANMNLSKSMFELSNQFCYSAVPFLLENVVALSQERAVRIFMRACEPGVDKNLFLERICKCCFFHFLVLLSCLCIGVHIEVGKQEIGIS